MYFSEWRKLQRDCEMFNISQSFVVEGISKQNFEKIVYTFLLFAKKELKIKDLPKIKFVDDKKIAKRMAAFGQIKDNHIVISISDRHPMDILRTVAHELIHYQQHSRGTNGNGKAGSSTENEANRLAGTIVRKFGEKHSNLFELPSVNEAKKRKRRNVINIDGGDHYPMELS